MAGTRIMACKCDSAFQDETYGKKMRVHNINKEGNKASCTVCEGGARYAKRNSKTSPPTTNRESKGIK